MANTFQGHFPDKNTKEDGHERAAPVARPTREPITEVDARKAKALPRSLVLATGIVPGGGCEPHL